MVLRRCLGVDGAGHRPDGQRCGTLIERGQRGRCPDCAPVHETTRTRERRQARPYTAAEAKRRAAAVAAHVEAFGWWCPGWRREAHDVAPGSLTADHPVAVRAGGSEGQALDVLCRSCNASKGTRSDDDAA